MKILITFSSFMLVALGLVAQVTFNVDMACAPSDFDNVFVTGPWCGWCANDTYNTMTDPDGDGIYTVHVADLVGLVEYKYAINGFADHENLVNDMVNGAACAPITDYSGYAQRTIGSGSVANDYYGTCDGVCNDVPPPPGGMVTFNVDMAGYAGTYGTVNLNGSFNGWCGSCATMTDDDGDGVYTLDVELQGGTVEYKFTVDGWTDQEEFLQGTSCTSTIDGYTNRTLSVSGDAILPTVCWNQCQGCVPGLGCTDINACNYDGGATEENGSCEYSSCAGCLDALACNYDESAQYDDPSTCEYSSCSGCLDASACNYNENAQYDDPTSCNYPLNPCEICSGGADGAGEVVFNDADGDGQCDAIPTFENVVVSVQHNTPCGTTLNITCDATIPTPAYVGFYIGCYGFTGTPVRIDEGGITQFELSWECGQLPLYASADQELQDYIDMYQCYEELNVVSSIDSCLWWNGGWGNGTCISDLGPGGFNGFSGSVEVMSNLSDFGTSSDYLYEMDALFNQLILEGYLTECADGTIWSNTAQECVPVLAADLDFDGCVGMTDLLDLLSVFGTCVEEVSTEWSCGDPLEYQGYDYETVQIGEQCWFAENLRVDSFRNGDDIPDLSTSEDWSITETPAFATNFNIPADHFYNWNAVLDERSLCPVGWHMPFQGEVEVMIEALGGHDVAGIHLKAESGWLGDGNGSNSSGFTGLPRGEKLSDGSFDAVGYRGYWWLQPFLTDNTASMRLKYNNDYVVFHNNVFSVNSGRNVRCIQDSE